MEFIEKNGKQLVLIAAVLVVVGFLITFFVGRSHRNEAQVQEKLAQIELDYTKYKEDFAKSQMPQFSGDPKPTKESEADKKKRDDESAQLKQKVMTSREKLTADLEKFISENPQSIGASMASLYLSEMLIDNNKKAEALEVLKKSVRTSEDLSSVLVYKKIGSLQADANQCDEAVKTWDQILKNKKAQYVYPEIKIMQSLCYQKNNDLKKAEELLTSVKNDKSEGAAEFSQRAEKILRLIQFKKMSGT
jgi:predicted negative regulator of RcsB-dependent stress response